MGASSQFRALFWKNLSLQRNQLKTTLIQVLIPFSLIMLVGLVQILIDNLAEKNSDSTVEYYGPLDLSKTIALDENGDLDIGAIYLSPPFFLFAANESIREKIGNATYLGEKSGLLSKINQYYQPRVPIINLPETYWPFYIAKESEDEITNSFVEVSRQWKLLLNDNGLGPAPDPEEYPKILNQSLIWIRNREYEELPPFGGIVFSDYEEDRLEYCVIAATRYGGWETKSSSNLSLSDIQQLFVDIDRRGNIINTVHNAFMNSVNQSTFFNIKTLYQGFPQTNIFTFDLSSIAGVFLYGFVSSLLLPVFIANLVTDKQEKVLLMMQMSGLKMSVYWLVAYLYDMLLYMFIVMVIYLTSFLFSMRMFTQTEPALLLLFFFLWGNALIGMCFLLSTFFSKSRTASVVGYLIVIVSVIISNLLNSSVYLAKPPPFWYMIYPPFAFYRGVFVFEEACIDLNCFNLKDLGTNTELSGVFLYLFIECLILYPVTYYLQNVLPNEFGVRKSPLFLFDPIINKFRKPKGYNPIGLEPEDDADSEREVTLNISSDMVGNKTAKSLALDGVEDEDVTEERRRIFSGEYPPNTQVIIKNIKKEYEGRYGQPKKKALHGVSFHIEENECFGLLGANGAGKTTLISILTGVFSPTSGSAFIAGSDILSEMDQVQTKIGVCPQFDIFYPELSSRQHLLFYGRLKGMSKIQEEKEVNQVLEDVGLTEVADRLSKDLSGGMRRRLSMAIAIIGNPKIVILDEPTTGLDPLTRRQIWDILLSLKKNRSMILTTHSMEEADVICDRIGIMSRGKMKCIGSQERLKSKFGSGYALTVFTDPNSTEMAQDFITKNFPDVELEEAFSGTVAFRIPKEKTVVSKIFEVMQFNRPEYIHDWGLSMTTLEDVFLNILRMDQS